MDLNAQIDHWETVVNEEDTWQYLVPSSEIPSWNETSFDDATWNNGYTPIGYGESYVSTNIGSVMSVYLRKEFTVNDITDIEDAVLHMDYDDGFVAYLNGVEIARALMSGTPSFNQTSDGLHESTLYQGIAPDLFAFDKNLLINGTNLLAVEIHNANVGSSDLIAHPILSVGLNTSAVTYFPTPDWFYLPMNFTSSDLPIVIIDTNGQTIVDDPKVLASISIISNSGSVRNNINDDPVFDWYCGIEIRGESSQGFEKRSYGIEIWDEFGNDMDTTFLEFPSEEDFILYGPYSDKTQMNNVLAMHIGNKMGRYSSRTRYVELIVNDDYRGLYVLMEKIKRDDQRVNVSNLNLDEISGDDLTGGYIVRIDKGVYGGWYSALGAYNNPGNKIYYQYYYPDPTEIHQVQGEYIKAFVDEFEEAATSPTFENTLGVSYLEYISLRSFVDTFILNELSKNVDGYRLSTYFNKQKDSKGGKFISGPFWDFNLSFGNGNYCGGDDITGWEYYQCVGNSPVWWDHMLQDTTFKNALKCRWVDLRKNLLEESHLNDVIDSLSTVIYEAQLRNFQRWPNLGVYLWPNPPYFYQNITSHDQIIVALKNWLFARADWMDSNMPGIARYCEIYEEMEYPIEGLIQIYPNPASDHITFRTYLKIYGIKLLDASGKHVGNLEIPNDQNRSTIPYNIKNGLYFMLIQTNKGLKMVRTVIRR